MIEDTLKYKNTCNKINKNLHGHIHTQIDNISQKHTNKHNKDYIDKNKINIIIYTQKESNIRITHLIILKTLKKPK